MVGHPRSERDVIIYRLLLKYAEHLDVYAELDIEERFKLSLEAFVTSLSEHDLKFLLEGLETALLQAAITGDFPEARKHLDFGYGGGTRGTDFDIHIEDKVYEFKKAKLDVATYEMFNFYIKDMRRKLRGNQMTKDLYESPTTTYPSELVFDLRDCTNLRVVYDSNRQRWDIAYTFKDRKTGQQVNRFVVDTIEGRNAFYSNPDFQPPHVPLGLQFDVRILLPKDIGGIGIQRGAIQLRYPPL